jgi:hypothetical protein
MSIFRTARTIADALRNDGAAMAKIRDELSALGLSIATDPNASMKITSTTVNGQSFTAAHSMTQSQRLQLLSLVVKMADAGFSPPSEAVAIF